MEALAVETFLVREIVERIGDEIDRDDIDAAAFDADRRHPWRQEIAHFLEGLEKIIRAVDLVDIACLRITDDEAGAVDAVGPLAFAPYDRFGVVLRFEIGMIEIFRFLEHVFAKYAVVESRGRDRAHMVETAGGNRLPELDGVARSVDVGLLLRLGGRLEVVDGGQMKKVVDLAGEPFCITLRYPEILLRQVADDGDDLRVSGAPVRSQLREFLLRGLANEHV